MKILALEPHRKPQIVEIDGSLKSMQETVKGPIEAIYPFDDPVALVCEEEALYHPEQKWNRPIKGYGVIKGTFFLCGLGEDDFTDLPQELTEKYTEFFRQAYDFVLVGNILMPIPLGE